MVNENKQNSIAVARLNKFSLNEDASSKISTKILIKLQIKNAASVYLFVNLFSFQSIHKTTLMFIECCFTVVSDTDSFKQLDYTSISKILASSSLFITSEIEIFKVAERWLNYDIEERSKYAKDILLKVRLHLLSKDTIQQLIDNSKIFKKDYDCVKILNGILYCEDISSVNTSSVYQKSRYCIRKSFNILVCGGFQLDSQFLSNSVSCIDLNNLGDVETYPPMITGRVFLKVVYVKGDLYVFGGRDSKLNRIVSVDKYSLTTKTWCQIAEMYDSRIDYCVCAFMDKIFFIGGNKDGVQINFCLQFDTYDYSWKEVSGINKERSCAACAVYEERIVVSGGLENDFRTLNTVESYDVIPDKWSSMPNMNSGKSNHSLVVVMNKLFIISERENTCEVFDNVCKMFVTIKSPKLSRDDTSTRAYSIGKKIFVFQNESPNFICFDTDTNEWSEESCEVTKDICLFSCVKVPYLC